jgi:hypothetical protein
MGARTTWELTLNGKSVYLYSHWGGGTKLSDTKNALEAARPRWHDGTYAMRIFISQIVGTSWNEETGFGISTENEFEENYTPAGIDFDTKEVTYGGTLFSFADFLGQWN